MTVMRQACSEMYVNKSNQKYNFCRIEFHMKHASDMPKYLNFFFFEFF